MAFIPIGRSPFCQLQIVRWVTSSVSAICSIVIFDRKSLTICVHHLISSSSVITFHRMPNYFLSPRKSAFRSGGPKPPPKRLHQPPEHAYHQAHYPCRH